MNDVAGQVAVITGAASGIGLALANKFAQEGMAVVLADIEAEPLQRAEASLKANGVSTLAVQTDVSREDDVNALADVTFGTVHVLCNNA